MGEGKCTHTCYARVDRSVEACGGRRLRGDADGRRSGKLGRRRRRRRRARHGAGDAKTRSGGRMRLWYSDRGSLSLEEHERVEPAAVVLEPRRRALPLQRGVARSISQLSHIQCILSRLKSIHCLFPLPASSAGVDLLATAPSCFRLSLLARTMPRRGSPLQATRAANALLRTLHSS